MVNKEAIEMNKGWKRINQWKKAVAALQWYRQHTRDANFDFSHILAWQWSGDTARKTKNRFVSNLNVSELHWRKYLNRLRLFLA